MFGIDTYNMVKDLEQVAHVARKVGELGISKTKVASIAEIGVIDEGKPSDFYSSNYLNTFKNSQSQIAFMCFWLNGTDNSLADSWQVPAPTDSLANDFREFASDSYTLFAGDYEMYTLPGTALM